MRVMRVRNGGERENIEKGGVDILSAIWWGKLDKAK